MAQSPLKYIKAKIEFIPQDEVDCLPSGIRGIYALFKYEGKLQNKEDAYNVVYIGMSDRSVHGRLSSHRRDTEKGKLWTHFSVLEVHDNIGEEEIRELEGILRHLYRKDTRANSLNKMKSFKAFKKIETIQLKSSQ